MTISYERAFYTSWGEVSGLDRIKKEMELCAFKRLAPSGFETGRSLDIGTATGRYMEAAFKLGFCPSGIDISPQALAVARERLLKLGCSPENFILGDFLRENFSPRSFRLITCMMNTVMHIQNREAFLKKVSEILHPEGSFIFSTWRPINACDRFLSFCPAELSETVSYITQIQREFECLIEKQGLFIKNKRYLININDNKINFIVKIFPNFGLNIMKIIDKIIRLKNKKTQMVVYLCALRTL